MTLKPFRVNPKAFHELIVMPQFSDVLDTNGNVIPSDEEGDWAVMDDVVDKRPILDLFGNQNVLKRRDATCKLIYSPVGRLSARYIRTEPLYAAVEDCVEEFYQGCFSDFEQGNYDMIFENLMPILEGAVAADIFTNKWFGDITRPADSTDQWSWNKFDGITTQIAKYIELDVITGAKTFAIDAGAVDPQDAKDALELAYTKQDFIMRSMKPADKAFYVDQEFADAYHDWLVLSGNSTVAERMLPGFKLMYRSIEVKVKQWDGILAALNGGAESAHMLILTLRGNFLYGADSKYGGGPKRNEAIRIWYSDDDAVWRRQIHLKAGTELVAPQHLVIGMTDIDILP